MSHILGKTHVSIPNSSQTQHWLETRTGSPKGISNLLAGCVNGLLKPAINQTLPSNRTVIVLAFVSLVAVLASGYLGWVALTSSKVVGSGGGRIFNCGHVISSRWSLWLGIPVSLLAIGLYARLAGALTVGASSRGSFRTRQIGWSAVTVLAITAGMAALWLISLQIFVLNHLCTRKQETSQTRMIQSICPKSRRIATAGQEHRRRDSQQNVFHQGIRSTTNPSSDAMASNM